MGNSSSQLVDKLTDFGNKTKKYVDIAYIGALFIFVAFYACTLTRSMPPFLKILYYISTFVLMLIAIYRLIVGKCKYMANTMFAILFVVVGIVMMLTYFLSISTGFINLTLIMFALIGALGVRGDYVLGAAICGNIVMILNNGFSTLFAEEGLFVNDYQDRTFFYFGDNTFYVSKMNNFSSTDLGAHYYWIVIAYLWLRGRKITWGEILALLGLNCFVYSLCASTTTMLCITLSVALAVMLKLWGLVEGRFSNSKIMPKLQGILGICAKFSFFIFAALSIGGAFLYNYADPITHKLNRLLHYRLSLGHRGILEYGIQLLENNVPSYGMSSSLDGFYNFLDCSYINLIIKSGVVMFLMYVGCMTLIQLRHKKFLYGTLLIAVCALACIEEHHLSELPYNIFMLLLFSDLDIDNKIKQPVKEKKKSETIIKFVSYPVCAAFLISSVCINLPRYQTIKEFDRLDGKATAIYNSIQGNLDGLVASGTWASETASMSSSDYGDVLVHPNDYETVTGEYWEEATKDPKAHSYYYFYYDSNNTSAISNLLISSETKALIGEGSIIVEYDVAAGKVYAVWVSESGPCIVFPTGRASSKDTRNKPGAQLEGYSTGG